MLIRPRYSATFATFLTVAAAASAAPSQTTAQSNAVTDRYMTAISTELTGKVDTKNAAVGQQVTAKTTKPARLADGTTLPKGTKLVGKVTQVEASVKGVSGSMLAMTFDHAELTGGQTLPLRSSIQNVAPHASSGSNGSDLSFVDTSSAGPAIGDNARASSARPNPSVRSASPGTGSALGTIASDTRTPVTAPGQPGTAVASAGESVSVRPRTTGLPGVMLSNPAGVSGALTDASLNISLDPGTQITLGVIAR